MRAKGQGGGWVRKEVVGYGEEEEDIVVVEVFGVMMVRMGL